MKIVKASAGSGKTYTLAHTYINLILNSKDRYAYRHILAVTFTNKATAEMKSRILRDLNELSAENPRAREILIDILHDYSAFSVSTIDKFFQRALKVFSREIGQFASYQLELDRDSLVNEAMDRILDSLNEEKTELLSWIKDSVRDNVENGEKFSFDKSLYDIGKQLKSEEFRDVVEKNGIDTAEVFSKENLDLIHQVCSGIIKDFVGKARALGLDAKSYGKVKIPTKTALKKDEDLSDLFGSPYDIYNTAFEINKLTYNLGLAGEFLKEFDAMLKEKNLMCLDESNTILRDIIDGSDAPFVYEKLGVRYDNFLLDEFQDTSNIQWENFLPLLKESESKSGKDANLIVGDVKQSIYRWRNSDWELLNSKVCREFPGNKPVPLDCNWRSCREIVGFNNGFFPFAALQAGASGIYSDVVQKAMVKDEDQDGFVKISFTEDQDEAVLQSINDARNAGAFWGDIAVLVRDHSHGAKVANYLTENGIPVISDDSLHIKSSETVTRLTALLSSYDNPDDSISRFIISSLDIVWPDTAFSLVDLGEDLLRQLRAADSNLFDGETLYIQAFMDDLKSWVEVNGNNLGQYLKHWNDVNPYISSPDNSSSVRIITVHKSKGLEFPYLIFPYADKVTFYKGDTRWCSLDLSGLAAATSNHSGTESRILIPVILSKNAERTLFAKDLERERKMQAIDNLNIFYVAMTRASKCLHVIADTPTKKFLDSEKAGHPDYANMSQVLYHYVGCCSESSFGSMYDFGRMKREQTGNVGEFRCGYPSIPLAGRLQPSTDAMDFFGEDGVTGPAASPRLDGIILHGILSEVIGTSDLRSAVDDAVREGLLNPEEGVRAFDLLSARIASHSEWFPSEGVSNEITIIGDDGECHRPDRVVENPDGGVIIIDYKFGEQQKSHVRQVGGYMELYRKMGRTPVQGVVWYVREDEVVRC